MKCSLWTRSGRAELGRERGGDRQIVNAPTHCAWPRGQPRWSAVVQQAIGLPATPSSVSSGRLTASAESSGISPGAVEQRGKPAPRLVRSERAGSGPTSRRYQIVLRENSGEGSRVDWDNQREAAGGISRADAELVQADVARTLRVEERPAERAATKPSMNFRRRPRGRALGRARTAQLHGRAARLGPPP